MIKRSKALTLVILILTLAFAGVASSNAVYAENVDLELNVDQVMSISLSKGSINLDVTPTVYGEFVSDTTTVHILTNSTTGYILSMSTTTDDTALQQQNTDSEIPSITKSSTVTADDTSNFEVNSWGYSTADTTLDRISFLPVPSVTDPDIVKYSNEAIWSDDVDVTYATKINHQLPIGSYTNTIVFSLIPNYVSEPREYLLLAEEAYRSDKVNSYVLPENIRSLRLVDNDGNNIDIARVLEVATVDVLDIDTVENENCVVEEGNMSGLTVPIAGCALRGETLSEPTLLVSSSLTCVNKESIPYPPVKPMPYCLNAEINIKTPSTLLLEPGIYSGWIDMLKPNFSSSGGESENALSMVWLTKSFANDNRQIVIYGRYTGHFTYTMTTIPRYHFIFNTISYSNFISALESLGYSEENFIDRELLF